MPDLYPKSVKKKKTLKKKLEKTKAKRNILINNHNSTLDVFSNDPANTSRQIEQMDCTQTTENPGNLI